MRQLLVRRRQTGIEVALAWGGEVVGRYLRHGEGRIK